MGPLWNWSELLETSPEKKPIGKDGFPRVVISLHVDDLDGLYQRLLEAGWTPFTQAMDLVSPDGDPIKMFCFGVENGLTIELIGSRTTTVD